METLIEFLKSSTVVDLLVLLLIVLSTGVLILVGMAIAFAARRRMPLYIFLLSALLPLLLALLGTYLRLANIEHVLKHNPEVGNSVLAAARQEAWITMYIGAAGTALLVLIGLAGVLTKREA